MFANPISAFGMHIFLLFSSHDDRNRVKRVIRCPIEYFELNTTYIWCSEHGDVFKIKLFAIMWTALQKRQVFHVRYNVIETSIWLYKIWAFFLHRYFLNATCLYQETQIIMISRTLNACFGIKANWSSPDIC